MKRSITALALALATVHCGGGDASSSPPAATGPGTSQDGGPPGPHGDAGCVATGATDDPDDDGVDANCDGADGVVGSDVYVNVAAGADTNAGTPTAPVRTIATAITLAAKTKGRVIVASGDYPVDALTIGGEAHLFGGYASSFVGAPKRAITTLHAGATGLLVDATKVSLAHLAVRGDAPSHAEQPSAYGVRVKSGDVALDDVEVSAADALVGAAGMPGAQGPAIDSSLACDGVAQPSYVRGASAATRAVDGTAPGDLGNKIAAAAARPGSAGTDGADAPATLALVDGLFAPTAGTKGLSDGSAGYGGAGGGLGRVATGHYAGVSLWSAGGSGGMGGCPGKGGSGGTSGGSSVAVLVLAGSLHVTRSHLHTGFGGAGGDGGAGGAGSPGALGTMPLPQNSGTPWFTAPASCAAMNASSDPLEANCAGYGGSGGDGGAGGSGGGGAGVWTIAIATPAGMAAQVDDATAFDLGRPGSGGTGHGGGRAPSGKSVRAYVVQ